MSLRGQNKCNSSKSQDVSHIFNHFLKFLNFCFLLSSFHFMNPDIEATLFCFLLGITVNLSNFLSKSFSRCFFKSMYLMEIHPFISKIYSVILKIIQSYLKTESIISYLRCFNSYIYSFNYL